MRSVRRRNLLAIALAATALALSACSGLPTTGDVQPGLALGTSPEDPDFLPLASGPVEGAGPAEIVEGFVEAAITPADNWATARSFMTPEMAAEWLPSTGVSIDVSAATRSFSSTVEDDAELEEGDTADVRVTFDQLASVDGTGAYSEAFGASTSSFVVVRTDGQWRISEAPDGVVLDESRFSRVYDDYALQFFDPTWERLVPDVRWFPRRATIATTIAQALIGGAPSPWLDPAVQNAFPAGVQLARDAVPIDSDQVADVALNGAAAGLDQVTLARMRTQLQETFLAAGVQVSQVRFSIDGRTLDAGVVKLVEDPPDGGSLVLKDGTFGNLVGGEVAPLPGVSEEILAVTQPITAVDVALDGSHAAVQLGDGHVYIGGNGNFDELDQRSSLIRPSMDPFDYTWSVPVNAPSALQAISVDVAQNPIADAWPGASEVSAIRVSADGARIAAVIAIGGERWVVVSAIIRDENGVPTALGPTEEITQLQGTASGLVWLGPDRLALLADTDDRIVLTQIVGGTGTVESAPAGATTIAGSRSASGVRIWSSDGAVFARSGSAWSQATTGVQLLATRAGH
ncbi:LpqB family beta-propeller domain-containing protein [Microbacterium hydrocarbonoxydans]|uniref:LpqB family beta-propeller domain-containing protein n=1 Tax=Microbacterium hydrocarbonoxydans TaxID=273678 RepID=UPI00203C682A|nr:LpqB family beta-propeller domain-containing protein [Microbacterium hydrocarbonoxydans]MCM3779284.1 LpqB family beta-propeller domain-containing protein [Microbacterium hydrocarbonoxydans]